ncbi:MAG: hypothetical protein KJ069_08185 [Anaerolineae bacterium]|nr:hypothetical protein [Anaerolineae bacterium]
MDSKRPFPLTSSFDGSNVGAPPVLLRVDHPDAIRYDEGGNSAKLLHGRYTAVA